MVSREPSVEELPVVELPPGAKLVELPRAVLVSNEASALATKIVLWVVMLTLAAGALLTAIGPHIPSGD